MTTVLAVLTGFLLDSLLGDPAGWWHPVCLIGKLISACEKFLHCIFPETKAALTSAGVILWFLVCGISFIIPLWLLWMLAHIHPVLAWIANTIFCYQIFARKCLADAGEEVYIALGRSLEDGRKAVSMYVGRDTQALDETGVIKATVETIAENTTDGVIAPMIYMLIGGAPLGFLYKAVNTLDSMVGYHNRQYEYFGKFSAKMDDLFNFIPARLAAICMIAGAGLLHFDNQNALRISDETVKIIRAQMLRRRNRYVPVHCTFNWLAMLRILAKKWKSHLLGNLIGRSIAMISRGRSD